MSDMRRHPDWPVLAKLSKVQRDAIRVLYETEAIDWVPNLLSPLAREWAGRELVGDWDDQLSSGTGS